MKEYVSGFGNPDWKRTHEEAGKTAIVVTALLKDGATCVGKTVMDELSFGYSFFHSSSLSRFKTTTLLTSNLS